ncbi:MAG TPA: universal stress protein [Ilumatobacteraceae bacterium]|nr:universal stress protein [Ilumatobacteraceae bacterium]
MTQQWIVGVDGSPASVDALRWAVAHAPSHEAELTAMSVFHVPTVMALFTAKRGLGVDELGLAATAAHELDVVIDGVPSAAGITARVIEGNAAQELVDAAAEADALILGQVGGGELRRHRLGSVARYCATHSSAPVVVVPTGWHAHPVGRVVVGFDGSANAGTALRWALEFTGPGAAVRVVGAMEIAPWLGERVTREQFPDEVAAEQAALTAAIDAIDVDGRTERMLVLDSPRHALDLAGRDADLIVVGTRGRGLIAAELLGSVSTSLLHNQGVPVAIIPHPEAS